MSIKKIIPSQVLNSRGEPTLKVEMVSEKGISASFAVPSGASVGMKEVFKKYDGNPDEYGGKGVQSCIELINNVITPKFIEYPLGHQSDFDELLIALDGSPNKQNLGGNTILALSGAYFKLSAMVAEKPLWQYIAENQSTTPTFPRLFANIIGGGKHAPGLDIQEFMIVPKSNKPNEATQQIVQVYNTIKTIMMSLYGSSARLVGDEGGITPVGARTEVVLEALSNLNAKSENKFDIALDIAANSFYDEKNKNYNFEGQILYASDLARIYQEWDRKFTVFSIEDPFAENDLEGLELLKTIPKNNKPFLIISDDYTVTNAQEIENYAQYNIFDGVIIKPDQVGSMSEMFKAISAAKKSGNEIIISHRSGETNDDFLADLAYGIGAYGIKLGSPNRGERIAKYNRLLQIENDLNQLQSSMEGASAKVEPVKTIDSEKNSQSINQKGSNSTKIPLAETSYNNGNIAIKTSNSSQTGRSEAHDNSVVMPAQKTEKSPIDTSQPTPAPPSPQSMPGSPLENQSLSSPQLNQQQSSYNTNQNTFEEDLGNSIPPLAGQQ